MSEHDRLQKWAKRRSSGAGPAVQPSLQSSGPVLPPSPAGYAYAWNAQANAYVLVPLQPPLPVPPVPGVQAWPGYVPHPGHPQVPPTGYAPGPRAQTCALVKAGPDPYADMMANVPEMVPDQTGGADAMAGFIEGRPPQGSAESQRALAEAALGSTGSTVAPSTRPVR